MNQRDKVRAEQINRVATFATNNAADLNTLQPAAKTKATALSAQLNIPDTGLVARLGQLETGRESGSIDFHGGTTSKATLRDGIILELLDWSEAAAAIASAEGTPEILAGFRIPHGVAAEKFGPKVLAICDHAETLKSKFTDHGFDDDFIDQMRDRVAAFDKATDDKATGLGKQTGAKSGLSATIREGVVVSRQLNVIFKQLYKDDPVKRTAWATAFHTERVGVSGKSKAKVKAKGQNPPEPKP